MEATQSEITLISDSGKGNPVVFREKIREQSEFIDNIFMDSQELETPIDVSEQILKMIKDWAERHDYNCPIVKSPLESGDLA